MNKELQRFAKAIKRLEVGCKTIYFDSFNPTNTQAFIEQEAFNNWFDEYELTRHGAGTYWQKTAYYDKIKFYALYSAEELSEADKETIKERLRDELEAL